MPRALWKGAISFGLVNIPVSLHSAEKRHRLDFTMLDRRNFKPVGYKRVNKETGREVAWENIVKGYEYEDGSYVALSEEDFKRANVEATQTVDIMAFVDAGDIDPIYYDTPYYLSPAKRGEKGYALLRETLRKSGKAAVANVVIRTRQYVAALLPMEGMLVLHTLRYDDEIRSIEDFDLPRETGASGREVDMALRLVKEMSEQWKPRKYHDTYRDDLLARIREKVKAGETRELTEPEEGAREPRKSAEVVDLMALLKRSVEEQGSGKSRKRPARARPGRRASHDRAHPHERRKRA
jgi:DNA end-binding protein Ku